MPKHCVKTQSNPTPHFVQTEAICNGRTRVPGMGSFHFVSCGFSTLHRPQLFLAREAFFSKSSIAFPECFSMMAPSSNPKPFNPYSVLSKP